jgi:hypothetical protein
MTGASGAAGPPSDEARHEAAYRAVIALPGQLGPEVCALVESQHELAGEVSRLRAALASAAQRARTQALEDAAVAVESDPSRGNKHHLAARIRALGASPEGRGSATP